jgi:hypothetical protein
LILWLFAEGFCNSADVVVSVVGDLAGFDGEPALDEDGPRGSAQLFPDLGVAELLGITAAVQTEQGGDTAAPRAAITPARARGLCRSKIPMAPSDNREKYLNRAKANDRAC